MRRFLPLALVIASACADGTGPVLAPCASTPNASQDLCGSWEAQDMVPGSAIHLDIRLHGDSIVGSGTYSIEAGRSGTLQVQGSYADPAVAFSLSYDYGARAQFSGRVTAGQQITGTLSAGTQPGIPFTFAPR